MNLKYFIAGTSLLAACTWLHHDAPFTAMLDAVLIVTLLGILAWFEPRCADIEWEEWRRKPPSGATYRRALWCFKLLAATVILIYGVFLLHYGSVEGFQERRQQDALIAEVDQLVATGHEREAAQMVEDAIRQNASSAWRTRLQFKLLECWLVMAARGPASEHGELITHAEQMVHEGLIERTALLALERYVKSLASEAELAKSAKSAADQAAREKTKRLIAESLADKREQRLTIERAEASATLVAAERQHAGRHFAQLLAWGDSLSQNLPLQRDKYQETLDFGRQWQFDLAIADARLRAVLEAIQREQPQDLAVGSKVKCLALKGDLFPPAAIVEVLVFDARGHHIEDLQAKDFRIAIDGQAVSAIAVAHLLPPQQRLQVVILIDCSGSTAGPALAAAKAGIGHLLAQLDGHADVCLIAFNSTTTPLSSFEANPSTLGRQLAAVQSAGGTALYAALDTALAELMKRPQPRLVLLFTDGKDSTGALADGTLDRLRSERVAIHAIGLETREFDRAAMERLTTATSGSLLTAAQAPELAERFAELSLALNAPRYRLVIPCQQTTGRLQITVGGKNAAVLDSPLEAATPWPPVKQRGT